MRATAPSITSCRVRRRDQEPARSAFFIDSPSLLSANPDGEDVEHIVPRSRRSRGDFPEVRDLCRLGH
jgi:hypothetical protein